MTEEQKPLSKKEQKRLAKKATKDGTKNDDKPSTQTAPTNASVTQPPIKSKEVMYFLANASKDCDASRKAAIASIAFNVKLLRAPPSLVSTIPTLF